MTTRISAHRCTFSMTIAPTLFPVSFAGIIHSSAGVIAILEKADLHPVTLGTYLQTFGPRFETKAEIRMYKEFFEYVGMTGANEATLAQEQGMGFCMVGLIDNMCHGLGEPLTVEV